MGAYATYTIRHKSETWNYQIEACFGRPASFRIYHFDNESRKQLERVENPSEELQKAAKSLMRQEDFYVTFSS